MANLLENGTPLYVRDVLKEAGCESPKSRRRKNRAVTIVKHTACRSHNGAEGGENRIVVPFSVSEVKTISTGVITPKTSHSPGHHPGHIPSHPFRLPPAATSETAAGHSARIPEAAVLALTAFLFGLL
jgi:hypothetical protein